MARPTEVETDEEKKGELAFLPERTCAICYKDQNPTSAAENEVMAVAEASGGVVGSAQTDITNTYETIPCGCLYCYVCIATKLEAEEGEGWICLRCGELVKECKPWSGDVVEDVLEDRLDTVPESNNDEKGQAGAPQDRDKDHTNQSLITEETSDSSIKAKGRWSNEESDSGIDITNG